MFYDLSPVDGQPTTFVISTEGKPLAHITGGNVFDLYNVYCELKRFDERRADDFMHGVVFGLQYPSTAPGMTPQWHGAINRQMEWPPKSKSNVQIPVPLPARSDKQPPPQQYQHQKSKR